MANLEELILLNLLDREDDENDSGEEGSDTRRARARVAYEEAFAMSDTCFIKNYRLSKSLVRDLFEEVRPFISGAHRSTDLTVETKVGYLIVL